MSTALADPTNMLGERILGSYEIVNVLGQGAMGAVYLARQQVIGQEVAIKMLVGEAADDAEIIQRFKREARVISMLTHPNIIRVLVFGTTPAGVNYMAMEYVKGRSLREELDHGPMDELAVIKIMKQIASALAEAHDLGIIHRDLKPENVLLTTFRGESNFVKILDFGIAKILNPEPNQKELTQAGIVYGTPEFISPEQAQALDVDHRTDIYSLGCMLFEMLTGTVPFTAKTALKVLEMQAFQPPPRMNDVAPFPVDPAMERIVLKAMAKKPADRFQSAMEMFNALSEREAQVLRERNLAPQDNYVPGGELSGMFRAVRVTAAAPSNADPQIRNFVIALAVMAAALLFLLVTLVIVLVVD